MVIFISVSGALPVRVECVVEAVNYFNARIGSDYLEVDAIQISSSTAAANNVESNIGNLNAAVSSRSSHAAADVWAVGTRVLTAATNITSGGNAILESSGKVTVATNEDKTGYSISGTKTTLDALNDVSTAEVNAQCDAAIETYRLDELIVTALGSQPTAGSILGDLTEDDGGTQRFTANALEEGSSGGGGGDATAANQTTIINALSVVDGIVDAIVADTNELQSNQGNWTTATGFATASALTAVDAKIDTIDGIVDAILIDTDNLQSNQSNWTTATGFSTFNPTSDVVAHVTLVDTTTTNTDMRGTDSAPTAAAIRTEIDNNSTQLSAIAGVTAKIDDTLELDSTVYRFTANALEEAPSGGGGGGGDATAANQTTIINALSVIDTVVDAILVDTDDLQSNQSNWTTATGFATASALSAIDAKIDTIDGIVDAILIDTNELQTNQGNWITATGFSTFNPTTDVVAHVTLVDTVTTNTDMRGTDSAPTAAAIRTEIDSNSTQLSAIAGVTAKVSDTLEDDGGIYRFTANALEEAPSGGGGGDATAANQTTIINALSDIDTVVDAILVDTDDLQSNQGNWSTVDLTATTATLSSIAADVTAIKKIQEGRWRIVGNQMIFYEDDNNTEIMRFNLFDASGDPAMTAVFDRQRV
jgi:hypothetical protein